MKLTEKKIFNAKKKKKTFLKYLAKFSYFSILENTMLFKSLGDTHEIHIFIFRF